MLLGVERAIRPRTAGGPGQIAESMPLFSAGARIGWSAPWSASLFGAYLNLGIGLWWVSGWDREPPKPRLAAPYVAPSFVVQSPAGNVRPFAALSGVAMLERELRDWSPILGATLNAGVAWSAW
jgi:hypothetical protein